MTVSDHRSHVVEERAKEGWNKYHGDEGGMRQWLQTQHEIFKNPEEYAQLLNQMERLSTTKHKTGDIQITLDKDKQGNIEAVEVGTPTWFAKHIVDVGYKWQKYPDLAPNKPQAERPPAHHNDGAPTKAYDAYKQAKQELER